MTAVGAPQLAGGASSPPGDTAGATARRPRLRTPPRIPGAFPTRRRSSRSSTTWASGSRRHRGRCQDGAWPRRRQRPDSPSGLAVGAGARPRAPEPRPGRPVASGGAPWRPVQGALKTKSVRPPTRQAYARESVELAQKLQARMNTLMTDNNVKPMSTMLGAVVQVARRTPGCSSTHPDCSPTRPGCSPTHRNCNPMRRAARRPCRSRCG